GRQSRPSLYDIRKTRPQPWVAREDCHTVRGRLGPLGHQVTPLDEAGLRRIAEQLREDRVEAVAICLLHAYANPTHERRARAILTAALPGIPVCISTDILAEFREYERASTVVLNAYLLPVMERYLASLTELLADPHPGHRHQRDRRRRRLDRVDRRGRRIARRAEERRGGARSRLLRPGRDRANRHRRQSRARPVWRGYEARRRTDPRPRSGG